jgi:hypothetical protein
MNRTPIRPACSHLRPVRAETTDHKADLKLYTDKLVGKISVAPDGHLFQWSREGTTASSTAYLFEAAMSNVQYAQQQLVRAQGRRGKQAFATAIDAARTYAYVLNTIMPLWTFRPAESFVLPDADEDDIRAHYCLARAMAFDSVGQADLICRRETKIVAKANAAHLYGIAAQLIEGDNSHLISNALLSTAHALQEWGEFYLDEWESDRDPDGACKAVACLAESDCKQRQAGKAGCGERLRYAEGRNQVHYMTPKLPPWNELIHPRIAELG